MLRWCAYPRRALVPADVEQVRNVVWSACREIVETQYAVVLREQALAEVGAEEPGSTGHDGVAHGGAFPVDRPVMVRPDRLALGPDVAT
jgi:hypothetical protein